MSAMQAFFGGNLSLVFASLSQSEVRRDYSASAERRSESLSPNLYYLPPNTHKAVALSPEGIISGIRVCTC
jgi:hypothetical protein